MSSQMNCVIYELTAVGDSFHEFTAAHGSFRQLTAAHESFRELTTVNCLSIQSSLKPICGLMRAKEPFFSTRRSRLIPSTSK